MFDRFMKILTGNTEKLPKPAGTGKAASSSRQDNEFVRLNELAPVSPGGASQSPSLEKAASAAASDDTIHSVVCREAVLSKQQRVAGYSFMLRRTVNQRVRASSPVVQRLYDEVLLRNILSMDIQRLLGHRLAFIPILPSSLDHPLLEQLPREGTVLIIGATDQLITDSEVKLARLNALKTLGYRIALQEIPDEPGILPFLELAEFIFIDVGASDIPAITAQIGRISKQVFDKQLVATNVQTLEEFHVCAKLPFFYFQGPFVTSREQWTAPRMDTGRIKILDLLNRIRREAEISELSAIFKQDPALSFKLLRYINSPGAGLLNKVNTIDQTLIILGRQKLYRWLTLLLFTSGGGEDLDWALMENALVRARLAELLSHNALPANERDELFVAGIFSLLDILLRLPMEKVLSQVSLPPLAEEALLHKRGKYAPYLELAIACEQFDQDLIESLSEQIGLDVAHVNAFHADALIWAQQVNE